MYTCLRGLGANTYMSKRNHVLTVPGELTRVDGCWGLLKSKSCSACSKSYGSSFNDLGLELGVRVGKQQAYQA